MSGEVKHSKRRLTAKQRQARALELRLEGNTYEQIASTLSYRSASGAFKAVDAGLRLTLEPAATELRALEAVRIDGIWQRLWQQFTNAVDVADVVKLATALVRTSERRSRLLGLDAPQKTEVALDWRQAVSDIGLSPDELFNTAVDILLQQQGEVLQ